MGKFILFSLLLLSIAEGVYFWSFSTPAYSLNEIRIGWRQIIRSVLVHPKVLEVSSMIEAFTARNPSLSDFHSSGISPASVVEDEL